MRKKKITTTDLIDERHDTLIPESKMNFSDPLYIQEHVVLVYLRQEVFCGKVLFKIQSNNIFKL